MRRNKQMKKKVKRRVKENFKGKVNDSRAWNWRTCSRRRRLHALDVTRAKGDVQETRAAPAEDKEIHRRGVGLGEI